MLSSIDLKVRAHRFLFWWEDPGHAYCGLFNKDLRPVAAAVRVMISGRCVGMERGG